MSFLVLYYDCNADVANLREHNSAYDLFFAEQKTFESGATYLVNRVSGKIGSLPQGTIYTPSTMESLTQNYAKYVWKTLEVGKDWTSPVFTGEKVERKKMIKSMGKDGVSR